MTNINIVSQIAMALYTALAGDLPPVAYRPYLPSHRKEGLKPEDLPLQYRRPREEEVDLIAFPQTWASTALGHGGLGGAAITTAQTVVVLHRERSVAAVYFGGRLAYVAATTSVFMEDLRRHQLVEKAAAAGRYASEAKQAAEVDG